MIVLDTNVVSELARPSPSPTVVDWVVLAFDIDSSTHYADILAARTRAGRRISAVDAQIAAISR